MATASSTLESEEGHCFFEGTEKLLEVWFTNPNSEDSDLRAIERPFWDGLLANVQCIILGQKSIDGMDAYILSESSMFISKNRFILKTCGRTTLLNSIKPLLQEAAKKCGYEVMDLFYSRKNFMKPELQHNIHKTFDDEVCHLDESFEHGAAYALGRLNRDCWYLYTIDSVGVMEPDQTLELLMTDLDPAMMHLFSKEVCENGDECTEKSGISKLVPGSLIDAYLFDPYGYSCNGLLENDQYFTIHVTPQPNCSYVSFETNVPQDDFKDMIKRVLDCFRPGKFLVTLFANKASRAHDSMNMFHHDNPIPGYYNQDSQHCKFRNYDLLYAHFIKPRLRQLSVSEAVSLHLKKPLEPYGSLDDI